MNIFKTYYINRECHQQEFDVLQKEPHLLAEKNGVGIYGNWSIQFHSCTLKKNFGQRLGFIYWGLELPRSCCHTGARQEGDE